MIIFKLDFLRNKAYGKILFFLFDLLLLVESYPGRLYDDFRNILFFFIQSDLLK